MYYAAKILEGAGLVIVAVGFMIAFPELMSMRTLGIGVLLFVCGWLIDQYVLKS